MRFAIALLALISLAAVGCGGSNDSKGTGESANNATNVKPSQQIDTGPMNQAYIEVDGILRAHCTPCHIGQQGKAGLDVSTYETLMKGTREGPIVVAGKPEESKILKALTGKGAKQMPPPGKGQPVEADDLKIISDWIKSGAAKN